MYFYVVVMSLFQRYRDPKDPVSPDYGRASRRRKRAEPGTGHHDEVEVARREMDMAKKMEREKYRE